MSNGNKGEVSLKINGTDCTIQYDWNAIGEIQNSFGKALKNVYSLSPDELAHMLAIGLKRHNPEFTAEKILALNPTPPIFPIYQAVDEALAYAYFGTEKKPEKEETQPDQPSKKKLAPKKKAT